MSKINNFKADFSRILEEDYQLTREEIGDFWEDKKQERKYNNTKYLIASIGAGGLAGTAAFTCVDASNGLDCIVPIAIGFGISALVTGVSLVKGNPYKELYSDELNDEYKKEKKGYEKRIKRQYKEFMKKVKKEKNK